MSRWLPLAFASLYTLVYAYGSKHPIKPQQMLRCWGLKADADMLDFVAKSGQEAETERSLMSFFGNPKESN